MQHHLHSTSRAGHKGWPAFARSLPVALALSAGAAFVQASAAEIEVLGLGTFTPPTPDRLANVPADLPFSKADLASGKWSFIVRYEDRTADSDFEPYVGRYGRAIHAFRLTVGSTTIDLPVDHAELIVSDGGLGFPERESIRIETRAQTPYGTIQVGWIQTHQTASRMDLRGAPGLLASDAMPSPSVMAHLPTDRQFDRFLLVRVDSPSQVQPLLYLSSSQLSVSTRPAPGL